MSGSNVTEGSAILTFFNPEALNNLYMFALGGVTDPYISEVAKDLS